MPRRATASASSSMSLAKIWIFVAILADGELFDHEHGDRVGFFAAGATGYPDSQRGSRPPCESTSSGIDALLEDLKRFGIAKKARHTDQQVLVQGDDLVAVFAEQSRDMRPFVPPA